MPSRTHYKVNQLGLQTGDLKGPGIRTLIQGDMALDTITSAEEGFGDDLERGDSEEKNGGIWHTEEVQPQTARGYYN